MPFTLRSSRSENPYPAFRLFVKWNGTDGGAAVSSSCWNKRKYGMDKRKKGVWSLFTDHVEWWQNYLTEISVLVVGLGLTYWGEHAVHRSAQGGREPPLPQAGVSGFRLSGGTEQGCMKKKQLSITENCFCVKLALLTKNYLHLTKI